MENNNNFEVDDSIKIELLKNTILDAMSDANLPIVTINLLLKDISYDINKQSINYTNRRMKEYKEYLKEKKDAETAAAMQPAPEPPASVTPPPMETVEEADIVKAPEEEEERPD